MSFVYVVSDGIKTKVGLSDSPSRRVSCVAISVFSSKPSDLDVLVIETNAARRAEAVMKKLLSEKSESAGGVYPTETFFVGFDDACAIARWAVIISGDEATASIIGYRKKKIMPISAKCKKKDLRIAMSRSGTKLAWLARKIGASQSSMQKTASGSSIGLHGVYTMKRAADALGMKVSELVALGEDAK